jgi:alkanesulfonate monooxygenase SsuD/methylene tetrahydromethanopterin reductase-like flavin-dependent oxidoreductase (luciferase family)
MTALSFGAYVLPSDPSHGIDLLRRLEGLEFDTAWAGDTLGDWRRPSEPLLDAWVALGAHAVASQRIRLGMLITNLAWRDPVLVARFAMSVDRLSGGRFVLGLGCGEVPDQVMAGPGVLDMPARERVDRLAEGTVVVDRLLRGDCSTFQGRFTRYDTAAMAPGPVQQPRPPLLIAGNGPRVIRLAADHADIWNTYVDTDLGSFYESTAVRVDALDAHLADTGRDPETLTRSLLLLDDVVDVWSDDATLPNIVERFVPLGFTEFVLYPPPRPQWDRIDHLARAVLPGLRAG